MEEAYHFSGGGEGGEARCPETLRGSCRNNSHHFHENDNNTNSNNNSSSSSSSLVSSIVVVDESEEETSISSSTFPSSLSPTSSGISKIINENEFGVAATAMTEFDIQEKFSEGQKPLHYGHQTMRHFCIWFRQICCLSVCFPLWSFLRNYRLTYASVDIMAGISEAIMAIPQGMSYAMLAGLPPIYGLYNGLIFPIIYCLFGTSPHVSVGVSAIEAVLCREAVDRVIGISAPLEFRVDVTIMLCTCVGFVYIIMRLMGLGVIADFLSDSVLSGFSTASAFLIGTKQFGYLFGGFPISSDCLFVEWYEICRHLPNTQWMNFCIGIASLLLLIFIKYINKFKIFEFFPLPGPLVAIVIFTGIIYATHLSEAPHSIRVIGHIPDGLPIPRVPFRMNIPTFTDNVDEDGKPIPYTYPGLGPLYWDLYCSAIPLAATYYIIHVSIVKVVAKFNETKIDLNQEIVALGVAQLVGCWFQCFPNATSLSRTSVVHSIGAKTPLHNLICSFIICLTLIAITPLLYYLPFSVLAAVVLVGVAGMTDFQTFCRLFRLGGVDVILWFVTFFVTLTFGAMWGIIVSMALSISWLLKKTCRPTTAVLGRLPDTTIYRNVRRFPMAQQIEGMIILRWDSCLNFSNAEYFELTLRELDLREMHTIIIDASSINSLDDTSLTMLKRVVRMIESQNVILLFANWKGPMRDFLDRAHFYENYLPLSRCFLSLHDAVVWAQNRHPSSILLPHRRRGHHLPGREIGQQLRLPNTENTKEGGDDDENNDDDVFNSTTTGKRKQIFWKRFIANNRNLRKINTNTVFLESPNGREGGNKGGGNKGGGGGEGKKIRVGRAWEIMSQDYCGGVANESTRENSFSPVCEITENGYGLARMWMVNATRVEAMTNSASSGDGGAA